MASMREPQRLRALGLLALITSHVLCAAAMAPTLMDVDSGLSAGGKVHISYCTS